VVSKIPSSGQNRMYAPVSSSSLRSRTRSKPSSAGFAAGELVTVDAAVAFHLDLQPLGEGVDDADADAAESPETW